MDVLPSLSLSDSSVGASASSTRKSAVTTAQPQSTASRRTRFPAWYHNSRTLEHNRKNAACYPAVVNGSRACGHQPIALACGRHSARRNAQQAAVGDAPRARRQVFIRPHPDERDLHGRRKSSRPSSTSVRAFFVTITPALLPPMQREHCSETRISEHR